MGSMIHLAVGRLEIDWGKNNGFSDHSGLFQAERDVADVPYFYAGDEKDDGSWEIVTELKEGLSKPLCEVKDRLELLGITLAYCEKEFEALAQLNDFDINEFPFSRLRLALAEIDVESLDPDYGEGGEDFGKFFRRQVAPRLGLEADISSNGSEGMENLSAHSVLRLLAENPKAANLPVCWAYADVEQGGWAAKGEFVRPLNAPLRFLLVTEGSSDAAILGHALKVLRPHIADFFQFVDMEEGYPFSGTGNVFRFVQGLISIAVQNKTLVVFDNDAEGVSNWRRTSALRLPPNMRCLRLPDREEFQGFATVGPDGSATSDINGRAAAIECYLDLDQEAAVRWTSYNTGADAYQGELIGKERYARSFFKQSVRNGDYDFKKLIAVLDSLVAEAVGMSEAMALKELDDAT